MIMTIKEFYEWAVARGVENYTLSVNYRDGGGWYCGCEEACEADFSIEENYKEVVNKL